MPDLNSTVSTVLIDRYNANSSRIHELATSLMNAQFWQRPFPFGNSFGHLILHLTGNLNYYIGAQIAKTGYVPDRPRGFNDPNPPSKGEALSRFDHAAGMVLETISAQSPDDWSAKYSGVGSGDAKNRLDIVVICAAHMQHHIGQMIYLGYELRRQAKDESR